MKKYILIDPADNVAVILDPVTAGTVLEDIGITVTQDIPAGHKCAIRDIAAGEPVIKYGNPIGNAKEDIKAGSWVHTHNVKTGLSGQLEYTYAPVDAVRELQETVACNGSNLPCTFMGYRRRDGRVGVRNEIWIVPTVGCVNHIAEELAGEYTDKPAGYMPTDGLSAGESDDKPAETCSIDAVVAMTHPYGCSQMGDDQENTAQILADIAKHPNCGGVLILSLGCENNNLDHMRKYLEGIDEERVRYLVCQNCEDEVEEGRKLLQELIGIASCDKRTEIPVSELIVGLKCGGSDGFSGITANPLAGRFSDIITAFGGSSILTEVPEMFGAEQLLMNRAKDENVFKKMVDLINGFKEYYERHDQVIYENPSPGNKQGGITTLEDKSLGCVQKSGSSMVMDVLKYGEQVKTKGLNLLEGPGNDMVAVTALAAAGAHIILFTTGRGTPLSSPVPTVKISSNSALANKKAGWIDFDAGRAVSADISLDELGSELFRYVIDVASGRHVKSEEAGYHSMTIFKQGVTL
ncbi:MAG: altronate dehydratase family protein [Lachnospiraceae bacterium]|nr:altronate dehydratase family protein [Lachnospiraceae bacterium]